MIKEALQYIVGLRKANVLEIFDRKYTDKEVYPVDSELRASSIGLATLTSLVDYINGFPQEMKGQMIVQVVSPTEVKLFSELDADRKRECLVSVKAEIPEFPFGRYIGNEEFNIGLQSKFNDDDNRTLLLKFAGTVKNGTIASYKDDGVSQKATIKTGVASMGDAVVPSPIKLRPYRTFLEVEQPASEFIFRMRDDKYDGVECALFEADGGAWKNAARSKIQDYLEVELSNNNNIVVIS